MFPLSAHLPEESEHRARYNVHVLKLYSLETINHVRPDATRERAGLNSPSWQRELKVMILSRPDLPALDAITRPLAEPTQAFFGFGVYGSPDFSTCQAVYILFRQG